MIVPITKEENPAWSHFQAIRPVKPWRPGRRLTRAQGGGYLISLRYLWKLARAWMDANGRDQSNGPYPT